MLRLYFALGIVGLLAVLGWYVKSTIVENEVLRKALRDTEELRIEAEDNVFFQQGLGAMKDRRITALQAGRQRNANELASWKERYEAALNKKPENRRWADTALPDDVREQLRHRAGRGADKVRAGDAARDAVRRLREAEAAVAGEERRPASGAEGVGDGAG